MIINYNCSIKLVPLVIFIYDARSHIHQVKRSQNKKERKKERKLRPLLRSLDEGLSFQMHGFDPRAANIKSVTNKVEMGQMFLRFSDFRLRFKYFLEHFLQTSYNLLRTSLQLRTKLQYLCEWNVTCDSWHSFFVARHFLLSLIHAVHRSYIKAGHSNSPDFVAAESSYSQRLMNKMH